jgi:cyclopropane fatty-acyl-phospholipid synthase-like methyltransferase
MGKLKRPRLPYQPRWEHGKTVGEASRECEKRYQALAPFVRPGDRVLDFGSWKGYFSHRLAGEAGATVVAVDPLAEEQPGVEVIRKIATPSDILALGEFDVVLALSILHHCRPTDSYIDALRNAAQRYLIVEVPHPHEKLGSAPRHILTFLHHWALKQGDVIAQTGGRYDPTLLRPMVVIRR